MDVGFDRALGLGALPLWPLVHLWRTLVVVAWTGRSLPGLLPGLGAGLRLLLRLREAADSGSALDLVSDSAASAGSRSVLATGSTHGGAAGAAATIRSASPRLIISTKASDRSQANGVSADADSRTLMESCMMAACRAESARCRAMISVAAPCQELNSASMEPRCARRAWFRAGCRSLPPARASARRAATRIPVPCAMFHQRSQHFFSSNSRGSAAFNGNRGFTGNSAANGAWKPSGLVRAAFQHGLRLEPRQLWQQCGRERKSLRWLWEREYEYSIRWMAAFHAIFTWIGIQRV